MRIANIGADANNCKKFNNNDYVREILFFGYDDLYFRNPTLIAEVKFRGSDTTVIAEVKKDDFENTMTLVLGDENGLCLQTIEKITVK